MSPKSKHTLKNILFKASLTGLFGVLLLATFGPLLGWDATLINPETPVLAPFQNISHFLGTDDLGRDLLARLAIGARISLSIGIATALVAVGIGTLYGIIAAENEGWLDTAMMRFLDIIYSMPGLMIVILFSVFMGRSIQSLVLALALFSWPDTARIIRGQVLQLRREEFIEAYHALGGDVFRLVAKHFIPNLAGLILLTATITVPRAILTESTLSFIGLGVEPPLSSWGTLASEGWQLVRVAPYLLILPAMFIFITMVALNWVGDVLRERFNPRSAA